MSLGTKVRLARLFSHPSGNLFGGAVDHFVGYGDVRKGGLADLPGALARVMAGKPDYVSIQPGTARHLWPQYAGKASLVIQAGCFTPDDRISELIATPEDAVRAGADALAVAIPVRGAPVVIAGGPKTDTLLGALKQTADAIRAGARGAVVGRNLWGHGDPEKAALAFRGVIHDGLSAQDALVAEDLMTQFDVEAQKMLTGEQSPEQAAANAQKGWMAKF